MPSNTEIHKDQEISEVRLNKVSTFIFLFFLVCFDYCWTGGNFIFLGD